MSQMIFKDITRLCKKEYGQSVKEAISSWRDNGFSQQFIAGKLGVSSLTVRRWAKKFGIVFDRRRYNAICRGGTKDKSWKCQAR